MKIAEVRKLLEGYSKQKLQLIIAEMYKTIPKAIKEDAGIDNILTNPDELKTTRKKKQPVIPDIWPIQHEAEEFIENAYQQHYFAPNSTVHKRERPKWRFIAKQIIQRTTRCIGR